MLLDDLVTTIQTVKDRISEHGNSLGQNEYRTRISLIDPILNALGWDVSNPALVTIEDQYSGGRPDYALLGQNKDKPVAFIEAKRLDESLNSHEDQVFKYTWDRRVFYAVLTDGNRWILRDVAAEFSRPPREGLLLDVTIQREAVYNCAIKFLLLWRHTFSDGDPVQPNKPVFDTLSEVEPWIQKTHIPKATTSSKEGWIPISEYRPGRDDPPPTICLPYEPDEKEIQLQNWYGLLVEISEWLISTGQLTKDSCPVPSMTSGYSMINSEARHENGYELKNYHPLSDGLLLNKGGNRDTLISSAKFLLKHFGKDPASILLKSSE